MSNKRVKQKLIELYGEQCFIDKLHLRIDTEPRKYISKGQRKKMKQLTYHHIKEKSEGGQATVENGALLSAENHAWFNKQSKEAQEEMNKKFQQYKECKVEYSNNVNLSVKVNAIIFKPTEIEKRKYNRAKEKREWKRKVDQEKE